MYALIINLLYRQPHNKNIDNSNNSSSSNPVMTIIFAKIQGKFVVCFHVLYVFIMFFLVAFEFKYDFMCFRLNYDNFDTILPRRIGHTIYSCCPGWTKVSKHSHGCTKRMAIAFLSWISNSIHSNTEKKRKKNNDNEIC